MCLLLDNSSKLSINGNDQNKHGEIVLFIACKMQLTPVVKWLLERAGDFEIDPSIVDKHGNTSFIAACAIHGNKGIINLLLKNSSKFNLDLNRQNNKGETAFITSCKISPRYKYNGGEEAARTIIKNASKLGIDLTIMDNCNKTGYDYLPDSDLKNDLAKILQL